jgi:hypothetical protein
VRRVPLPEHLSRFLGELAKGQAGRQGKALYAGCRRLSILIPKQENNDWGSTINVARLGHFYMNDRILHGEDFILHLYNAMNERVN